MNGVGLPTGLRAGWRLTLLCGAALLASCGGGGGGSSAPSLQVSADRSSLDFVGLAGQPARTQQINFSMANGSGTYYGQIVPDRPADFAATFTPTGNTSAAVTLTPLNPSAGRRSGSIEFRLCSDANCNKVEWRQSLPYRYAMFSIDASALAIAGSEGAAAPVKTLSISPADTDGLLSVSPNASASWLAASLNSTADAIQVNASAASLMAGTYGGAVLVRLAGSNTPLLSIPVGFTVGSGFVAPVAAPLVLGVEGSAPVGSTALTFNGGLSPAWTASSDQAWLVLDTPSGNGPGPLRYHVDLSRLGELANWSATSARVTLRAPGLSDATLDLTLEKRLPEIHMSSPATVVAGQASTVRVFGRGLSQLTGVGRISVAGAGAISGSIVSDREAVLQVPALAAGRFAISVSNAAGLPTRTGTLGAATRGALPAGSADNPGDKRQALFDPTRNTLYAVNGQGNTLVRYRYAAGQWQVDGQPIASIGGLAMAPDRKTLYVGSGTRTLLAVDPDNLQIKATHAAPGDSVDPSLMSATAVTNNLRLWYGGSQWSFMGYFDLISGSFGTQAIPNGFSLYSPQFHAPGDGSKLYVVNPPMLSPRLPSYVYTTASDSLSAPANEPGAYNSVSFSEDGSRLLIDRETLYDGNDFRLIGSVAMTDGITLRSVVSPDGLRVYRLASADNNSLIANRIEVYDATRVQPGTSTLVKLGQIPVSEQALWCQNYGYDCDVLGSFLISPLGDTLFWVGNQRLIVYPIPDNLSGLQAPAAARLKAAATR